MSAPMEADAESGFAPYLAVLRRRKLVIILVVIVVMAVGLFRTASDEDTYEADGRIVLDLPQNEDIAINTQLGIIESEAVADLAADQAGVSGRVDAVRDGESQVVVLVAESDDPDTAAALVNARIEAYDAYTRQRSIDDFGRRIQVLQGRADQLRLEVESLDTQIADAVSTGQVDTPDYDRLVARRNTQLNQQVAFEERIANEQIASEIDAPEVQVVGLADVPTSPAGPDLIDTAILSLGLGLALGVALALLVEYFNDTVSNPQELRQAIGDDLPILASIPVVRQGRRRGGPAVVSLSSPRSPTAEAYRSMRTALDFLRLHNPLKVIMVTSARPLEGKSTTVANLAVLMAGAGRQVILIDTDLRRPRLHQFFDVPNDVGFTSVLFGEPLDKAVVPVPGVKRLYLLTSGPVPPNPAELLSSTRCREMIEKLRASGWTVLLDTPPLLPVTDPSVLAAQSDAAVFVVAMGANSRGDVRRAADLLRAVEHLPIGLVLNKVARRDLSSYEAVYDYSYQAETERRRDEPAPPPPSPDGEVLDRSEREGSPAG